MSNIALPSSIKEDPYNKLVFIENKYLRSIIEAGIFENDCKKVFDSIKSEKQKKQLVANLISLELQHMADLLFDIDELMEMENEYVKDMLTLLFEGVGFLLNVLKDLPPPDIPNSGKIEILEGGYRKHKGGMQSGETRQTAADMAAAQENTRLRFKDTRFLNAVDRVITFNGRLSQSLGAVGAVMFVGNILLNSAATVVPGAEHLIQLSGRSTVNTLHWMGEGIRTVGGLRDSNPYLDIVAPRELALAVLEYSRARPRYDVPITLEDTSVTNFKNIHNFYCFEQP